MKTLITVSLILIMAVCSGCSEATENGIIRRKSLVLDNPSLSSYSTGNGLGYFIDSTHRYNIGDSVNKYKSIKP